MSSRFREVFKHQHVVLPVIHAVDKQQALKNAAVAQRAGCDGVFVINHSISHSELMVIHEAVTQELPGFWVGINSLGTDPVRLFENLPTSIAGVWTDNAEIDERQEEQAEAQKITDAARSRGWNGLYFGGVAFKYQRPVEDLASAARTATEFMDVITTSGSGTGSAAAVEKIAAMKQAIGEFPLAIASGITPENVGNYLPHADCFLVATGISSSFTKLDPPRVKELVEVVRGDAA